MTTTGLANEGITNLGLDSYAKLVWNRRKIIAICALIASLLSLAYSFLTVPIYQATTTLEISRRGPDVLTFRDVMSVDPYGYRTFFENQLMNLRSQSVIRLAAERIDLKNNAEWASRKGSPIRRIANRIKSTFSAQSPADLDLKAINFVSNNLSIDTINGTQHFIIRFKDRSPKLAQDIANAIAFSFQEFNSRNRYDTTEQASEFLAKDVAIQQARIKKLQEKLQEISSSKKLLALSDGTSDISEQALADLNSRLSAARAGLALAEAKHTIIRDAPPDALPEVQQSNLIGSLKERHATIERKYNQLAEKFKPEWPVLRGLEQELTTSSARLEFEISNLATQVRSAAKTNYEQALAEVRFLDKQVEIQKTEVKRVNLDAIAYSALKEEIKTERNVLNQKIERRSETETATRLQATTASNIRIIDMAALPTVPISPKKLLNLFLCLVAGTSLGISIAFVLHSIDNSIKTNQDIAQYAPSVAVLGQIPDLHATQDFPRYRIRRMRQKTEPKPALTSADTVNADLVSHEDPRSIFAEEFRNLRTSLLLASPDHPPKSLAVSSPNQGEGKSTITLNLAIVLAQQGKKVLLVDADLRKPRIHKALGLENRVGLSNYLSGNVGPENLIRSSLVPNLDIITSGPIPPNPSELIGSPLIQELLVHLDKMLGYDHVLFDSPPALQVTDAVILNTKIDGTILVVQAGETSRESLQAAKARFTRGQGHLFGCVLNGVREQLSYYKGYMYRYHHKSKQETEKLKQLS